MNIIQSLAYLKIYVWTAVKFYQFNSEIVVKNFRFLYCFKIDRVFVFEMPHFLMFEIYDSESGKWGINRNTWSVLK